MLNGTFSPWPSFTQEEADAVQRVLLSNRVNYWTGGETRAFESEFAEFAGSAYAIALANGTVALDIALVGLGIGPGDEVIVTPRSFVASASCVVTAGATPRFADVDADSGTITPETVAPLINERTKAVIAVHLAGWPCDMDGFMALAREHDLHVIEDCAQAHGALVEGRSVGALGHVGCWSFCQDKIMTTAGEGGMVTCDDPELWSRMWSWKDHGKSWEAVYEREHPPGFRWLHEGFGTNWRMTEMQAVIGRIQLGRMPEWHQARTRNAHALLDAAEEAGVFRVPRPPESVEHGWYKLFVYVDPARLAPDWDRDRVVREISARGVPCMPGLCSEVYRERAFMDAGLAPARRLPVARELGETSVMFMVHPTLTADEIALTCQVISEVGRAASR